MTLLTRNLSLKQTDRFVSQSSLACLTGLISLPLLSFSSVPLRKHVTYNKGFNRNIPHAKPSSSVIDEAPKQRNTGEVNVKSEIVNTTQN